MKITVDFPRCDGHGACVEVCPQVFAIGEDDDVVVVLDDTPDERMRDLVARAAAVCPKAAIAID